MAARREGPYASPKVFYATEAEAFARVEKLRGRGIWPGVIETAGVYTLTMDPDVGGGNGHGGNDT